MALFYQYIFDHDGVEFIFYAASRVEAEQAYKETFGMEPDRFLRREPW